MNAAPPPPADLASLGVAAAFEFVPEALCILDREHRLVKANAGFSALLAGLPGDATHDAKLYALIASLEVKFKHVAATAQALRDQPVRWPFGDDGANLVASIHPVLESSGAVLAFGLTMQKPEFSSGHSTPQTPIFLDEWPVPIRITDANGQVAFANRCWRERFGQDDWLDALDPGDRQRVEAELRGGIAGQQGFDRVADLRLPEGEHPQTALIRVVPTGLATGEKDQWLWIALDGQELITDLRKRIAVSAREGRDRFLSNLVHEFRNPLAPILTSAQLLDRKGAERPELLATATAGIVRQVRRLTAMIDSLAELSRLGRGMIQIQPTDQTLKPLLDAAAERLRPLAESRNQTLKCDCPGDELRIAVDAERFPAMLDHLLVNASNFTPTGGSIRLNAVLEDGEVVISVSDTGIGLDPRQLAALDEPFVPVTRPVHGGPPGFGTGLAMVRGITALHGGRFEVHSAGRERGCAALIRLPCNAFPGLSG